MRLVAAVAATVAVLAGIVPATAAAYGNEMATFRVTMSGTYTTKSTVRETNCGTLGPNGTSIPLPDMTAHSSEHVRFTSVRPITATVELLVSPPLFGGSDGRPMSIRVTSTRSTDLDAKEALPSCNPPDRNPPAQCGTRSATFPGNVHGALHGNGLGFVFAHQGRFVYEPQDIFPRCPLAEGDSWFGDRMLLTGPAPPSKLFNPRVKTVVIHAHRSGSLRDGSSRATSQEHFTLTLKRLRR